MSPEQIRAWWGAWWPEANVGIVCGAESNLYVIDIDYGHDGAITHWNELCAARDPGWGSFFDTFSTYTGSGSVHLYFRHPGAEFGGGKSPNTIGKLAPGINTIGDGGYVVAPPSRHASGRRYKLGPGAEFTPTADLHSWLAELLHDIPRQPQRRGSAPAARDIAAVPNPEVRPEPPPVEDGDLAQVIEFQSREQMTIAAQIEAARAAVTPKAKRWRPLANRSPLALYQILTDTGGRKIIFGVDGAVRLNELSQEIWFADRPISSSEPQMVRIEIEREYQGDDKNGGLKFSLADVESTMRLVAEQNSFNPVRDYLNGLKWDGVLRIEFLLEEVLGADRTEINIAMLRKWMISAVARAMKPGCKADAMLVLIGDQGDRKGTFFEILAGRDWYTCSPINIHDKDAASMMHAAWIMEWAELRSMMRATDIESVKAFLTTAVDKYRPPYGRVPQGFPRTCVVCGTSNRAEFLADDTGNRRFWPLTVGGKINLDRLREQRDQLWAEAVAALNAGDTWWLDEREEGLLPIVQRGYEVEDSWEGPIGEWLRAHYLTGGHTTADVLRGALDKPIGQWNRADEMRVTRVLTGLGYKKDDASRPRRWKKPIEDEAIAAPVVDSTPPF